MFIEQNLKETIETGRPSLAEVRHHLLSSSALYFSENLPEAQLHYGIEDGAVSIANAVKIKEVLEAPRLFIT